jgi:hypothetical protein
VTSPTSARRANSTASLARPPAAPRSSRKWPETPFR